MATAKRQYPAATASLSAVLLAVVLSTTACSSSSAPQRSEASFCKDLRDGETELNGSAQAAGPGIGAQLSTLGKNIGRFTSLLHHLDDEAPEEIATDMHDVRVNWDQQKDQLAKAASDPIGGLLGSLASSVFTSGATISVDEYSQAHCGAQLFGSADR